MNAGLYFLVDFGNGRRLEQWGQYRLIRPDPTAVDAPKKPSEWQHVDAEYRGEKGSGVWKKNTEMPESWSVVFDDINLLARLAPYKHTGIFPEQQQNWRWMRTTADAAGRKLSVLNLFAYTGGASIALAKDGHRITHVDASKPAITWAKENAELNTIPTDRIRWILEDAPLFASRELKRGKRYDAIILDPPAFGHSPTGKTWRTQRDLAPLLEICASLLSDKPAFLVLNGYATHDTPESFHRLLTAILHQKTAQKNITVDARGLFLKTLDGRQLSTGTVVWCGFTL